MEKIEFSRWLFEGRPRQGKNLLPDGLNWLCYFGGSSKSHHENSISFIFLESPTQVDMKNVNQFFKHFFWYFNTLETHSVILSRRLKTATSYNYKHFDTSSNTIKKFTKSVCKLQCLHLRQIFLMLWPLLKKSL